MEIILELIITTLITIGGSTIIILICIELLKWLRRKE